MAAHDASPHCHDSDTDSIDAIITKVCLLRVGDGLSLSAPFSCGCQPQASVSVSAHLGPWHHLQVPDEDSTKEKQAKADEEAKKEGKEAADPVEPVTKSQGRDVWDWRVQNDNKPLWTRSPKDVSLPPAALELRIPVA